ncbi:MAG: hypothetical protein HY445_03115 [Candidatus Niyogibacteria bacterium]|nr:hypothetical protein [Candidatus Niyogibacteria bacterium]
MNRVNSEIYIKKILATGNEAAAWGVSYVGDIEVPVFPITPQTTLMHSLVKICGERSGVRFTNVESEHSMFTFAIGATMSLQRSFSATSSQGLFCGFEQLPRACGGRDPIVFALVGRAPTSGTWSLETDHADSMIARDYCIQFYASRHQEILFDIIFAYKVAEHTMLPTMICLDGLILSHNASGVLLPRQEIVDTFLPPFNPPLDYGIRLERPRIWAQIPDPEQDAFFHKSVLEAMRKSEKYIQKEADEFSGLFEYQKIGLVDVVGNPSKADYTLIAIGTMAEVAKKLVSDQVAVVRIHTYRPFPKEVLEDILQDAENIIAVDRSFSYGSPYGPLATDIRSLFLPKAKHFSFTAGTRGLNVTDETYKIMIRETAYMKQNDRAQFITKDGR